MWLLSCRCFELVNLKGLAQNLHRYCFSLYFLFPFIIQLHLAIAIPIFFKSLRSIAGTLRKTDTWSAQKGCDSMQLVILIPFSKLTFHQHEFLLVTLLRNLQKLWVWGRLQYRNFLAGFRAQNLRNKIIKTWAVLYTRDWMGDTKKRKRRNNLPRFPEQQTKLLITISLYKIL